MTTCALCSSDINSSELHVCSCRLISYCSADCRISHWTCHKFECPALHDRAAALLFGATSDVAKVFSEEFTGIRETEMARVGRLLQSYPNVEVRTHDDSGPSLLSARNVLCAGQVLISEKNCGPVVRWACLGNSVPAVYDALEAALRDGTISLQRELLLNARVIRTDVSRMAADISRIGFTRVDHSLWALAVRCASHGLRLGEPAGEQPHWGLFAVSSLVTHSCSPNVMWIPQDMSLVSLRPIASGEPLTVSRFDDFSPRMALMGSDLRKEALAHSHFVLPACECIRCSSSLNDPNRTFFCPLSPCQGLAKAESHAADFGGCRWRCGTCGEWWESPPSREHEVSRRAFELAELLRGDAAAAQRRNVFADLRALVEEVSASLGYHHWAYLFACDALITFFIALSNRFRGKASLAALQQLVPWGRKYLFAASCQKATQHCSGVVVEQILRISRALDKDVRLHAEKIKFLRAADSLNSAFTKDIRELIGASRLAGEEELRRWLLCDDVESDGDVLAGWEDFIVQCVVGEAHSKAAPALPADIRQILLPGDQ
jgi:hypothetical protein